MGVAIDRHEAITGDVGVHLSRTQIGVSEQFLNDSEICSTFEQVGGESMAECVRVQATPVGQLESVHDPGRIARGQASSPLVHEQSFGRGQGRDQLAALGPICRHGVECRATDGDAPDL